VPELPPSAALTARTGRRLLAHVHLADVGDAVSWAQHAQDAGVITEFAVGAASLEDVYATWVQTEGAPA
jgi:hypothetical protein